MDTKRVENIEGAWWMVGGGSTLRSRYRVAGPFDSKHEADAVLTWYWPAIPARGEE